MFPLPANTGINSTPNTQQVEAKYTVAVQTGPSEGVSLCIIALQGAGVFITQLYQYIISSTSSVLLGGCITSTSSVYYSRGVLPE